MPLGTFNYQILATEAFNGGSGNSNITVGSGGSTSNTVTVTNPGSQSGTVGTAASVQIQATVTARDSTGASGSTTFTWSIASSGGGEGGGGGGACQVAYSTTSQWTGGFTANVTITNSSTSAINGWTLKFTFPGDQKITSSWNTGSENQSGESVTMTNASYNGTIAPGGNTSIGFQGTWTNSDAAPSSFTLNGATCT